jgi:hypothetical protein
LKVSDQRSKEPKHSFAHFYSNLYQFSNARQTIFFQQVNMSSPHNHPHDTRSKAAEAKAREATEQKELEESIAKAEAKAEEARLNKLPSKIVFSCDLDEDYD